MNKLRLLALLALIGAPLGLLAAHERVSASRPAGPYLQRADVREFILRVVQDHGFVKRELEALFRKATYQPDVIRAMTPPAEAPVRSWRNYRAMFVNAQRVEAALKFRERHGAALQRAAGEFGVPEEIILAIIGVETVFGRNMGRYRVIDALTTLAFDFPRRAEYFRGELEQFLLYARESGVDVLAVRGSYAGAIGLPQFMPGSYRRFAVDFDGDGRANLIDSASDAIGSVANFLKGHGWQAGQPAALAARVDGDGWRKLAAAGIKPSWRFGDLKADGVSLDGAAANEPPPDTLAALVELETPGQHSVHWVGLQNFYTLTRYNRSSFYAIAVVELSAMIGDAVAAPPSGMR